MWLARSCRDLGEPRPSQALSITHPASRPCRLLCQQKLSAAFPSFVSRTALRTHRHYPESTFFPLDFIKYDLWPEVEKASSWLMISHLLTSIATRRKPPDSPPWEPENNLRYVVRLHRLYCPAVLWTMCWRISGDQILDEYYATIGGEDQIFKRLGRIPKTKRTGWSTRRRISSISGEQWTPPPGSCEEYIEIDDCQGDNDGNLIVYLAWKNG